VVWAKTHALAKEIERNAIAAFAALSSGLVRFDAALVDGACPSLARDEAADTGRATSTMPQTVFRRARRR
jgi:hypothetical protein